jgi:hypothetical protein
MVDRSADIALAKVKFFNKIPVYKDSIPICAGLLKNFDVSFVPLSIV